MISIIKTTRCSLKKFKPMVPGEMADILAVVFTVLQDWSGEAGRQFPSIEKI